MTTLVYTEQGVFIDSQVTQGNVMLHDDYEKFVETDDFVYLFVGEMANLAQIANLLECDFYTAEFDKTLESVLLTEKFVYRFKKESSKLEEYSLKDNKLYCYACEFNYAYGSGAQIAIGALEATGCGFKAMEVAIKKDVYTGGKIHHFENKSNLNELEH